MSSVRALLPVIASCREQIETERQLPPPLVDALDAAGLFRMALPRRLHGGEVDPITRFLATEALARGDASTAWCVDIISGTAAILLPSLNDEVARQIFGPDGRSRVGGTPSIPAGRAVVTEGGYRLTGRWPFGSGCRHCQWLVGSALVCDPGPTGSVPRLGSDGMPEVRALLFPAVAAQIIDTWNVTGLRGTGSHDFAVDDLFVPAAHCLDLRERRPLGPLYLARFYLSGMAGVALGTAAAAMDAFVATAARRRVGAKVEMRERGMVQLQVAQAAALIGAARDYLLGRVQRAWATACAGGPLPIEEQAQVRLAATNAVHSAAQAVALLCDAAGTSAVIAPNLLERCFRDLHVMKSHIAVATASYELVGRVLLGIDPGAPFIL